MIEYPDFRRVSDSRSFLEEFSILMKREWIIFMRNKLKGLRLILISMLIVLTSGLIFLNAIKENRPIDGEVIDAKSLRDYLIKAQGTIYIAVLSCIMSNVNTVALSCTFLYYKFSPSRQINLLQVIIFQQVPFHILPHFKDPH